MVLAAFLWWLLPSYTFHVEPLVSHGWPYLTSRSCYELNSLRLSVLTNPVDAEDGFLPFVSLQPLRVEDSEICVSREGLIARLIPFKSSTCDDSEALVEVSGWVS